MHRCILAIFKARALKFWLQVGLKIDPKSYYIGHDPKRSFSWRFLVMLISSGYHNFNILSFASFESF